MKRHLQGKNCENWMDVADVVSHNAETVAKWHKRTGHSITLLSTAGIIFGIAVELRFRQQEDKIIELSRQIKELRDKEG